MSVETSAQISSQEKTKPQRPICCKSCGQVVAERGIAEPLWRGMNTPFATPPATRFT